MSDPNEIRKLAKKVGLEELARQAGVSYNTCSRWQNCRRRPKRHEPSLTAQKLLDYIAKEYQNVA